MNGRTSRPVKRGGDTGTAAGPLRRIRLDTEGTAGRWLAPDDVYYEDVEIGMSLTGMFNLAEGPLLERIGDLRWAHISALTGVPSRGLEDTDGNRVYPAFFYVHVAFPPSGPMASYRENDRLVLADTLRRYGSGVLDGTTYLLPSGTGLAGARAFADAEEAVAAEIPAVRLSNVFVTEVDGARRLKKSPPANPGFSNIAELERAPDAFSTLRGARENGVIERPGGSFVPLCDGPEQIEYDLVPERDINGVGLLYFANYPVILDICERRALLRCDGGFRPEILDRRTVIERTSVYLRNASADDAVSVTVMPWLKVAGSHGGDGTGHDRARLHVNYQMRRLSDGELMMVSSAKKCLYDVSVRDLEVPVNLVRRAGRDPLDADLAPLGR